MRARELARVERVARQLEVAGALGQVRLEAPPDPSFRGLIRATKHPHVVVQRRLLAARHPHRHGLGDRRVGPELAQLGRHDGQRARDRGRVEVQELSHPRLGVTQPGDQHVHEAMPTRQIGQQLLDQHRRDLLGVLTIGGVLVQVRELVELARVPLALGRPALGLAHRDLVEPRGQPREPAREHVRGRLGGPTRGQLRQLLVELDQSVERDLLGVGWAREQRVGGAKDRLHQLRTSEVDDALGRVRASRDRPAPIRLPSPFHWLRAILAWFRAAVCGYFAVLVGPVGTQQISCGVDSRPPRAPANHRESAFDGQRPLSLEWAARRLGTRNCGVEARPDLGMLGFAFGTPSTSQACPARCRAPGPSPRSSPEPARARGCWRVAAADGRRRPARARG
ncbi:hypothetical protein ENSA7_06050 [Enhygromyxa salina]|uniref:Uncharacterized protein n=1 Tax=Enhygromyxa salina TaxID=215803 RepID=A0A2S9YX98_9BACT|nr:hypothetical protein ENSA7_06050 [Enhygromyxa salina]